MDTMNPATLRLPRRPASATPAQIRNISQKIELTSNLFKMNVDSSSTVGNYHCYQYDCDFEPEVAEDNRSLRYSIFQALKAKVEQVIGKFVFSGKSLFTLQKLSQANEKKVESVTAIEPINVNGTKYTMRVKFTKEFEVTEEEMRGEVDALAKKGNKVTQVINVILKQAVRDLKFVEIGRNSKFFNINTKVELGGLEIFKGLQFGTNPTANSIYLMTDYATRILRKETALEFLGPINSQSESLIVGESVITTYNNYQTYKIDRLDTTKNPASTFIWSKTNQKISFAEYYKQRYGKVVRDMRQPLLVSVRKFREANTNVQRTEDVFLIPEFCNMTGLTDRQRADFGLMKDISAHTKLEPQQRYRESLKYASQIKESVRSAGLSINTDNSKIDALRLNPPVLTFGQGKTLTPVNGNFDMRQSIADTKLVLKEWSLIYSAKDRESVDQFVETLTKAGKAYNIDVQEPFYFERENTNPKDWIRTLKDDFAKNGLPSFVVSFAPNIPQTRSLYPELKQFLYREAGIEHQHVTPKALSKNAMSVASKVALQIAAKLGKKLWLTQSPKPLEKNTMLVGIETSMKKIQEGKQMKQAIGVVASVNDDFTQFYSEVDIRSSTDTALPTLSSIIKKSLAAYVKQTKKLPENVIVYRQGLGEGQIQQSLSHEITAVQRGFKEYKDGFAPKLAFFQVNKKIGQKFYENSTNPRRPGLDNPVSGALVANDVVGNGFEFFLCAQNCNSGVCTPTKYTCLTNTTNFSEDVFWQLTYFQCFNYYNWQGPVRVPAPMMYAGKLAKFSSDVLNGKANDNLGNSVYYL